MNNLTKLLRDVRSCIVCAEFLPETPRPVPQVGSSARIIIIGQAPVRVVHESGVPWADRSGDTLRDWLGLSAELFYDPDVVALVPMGFCYPGSSASGDEPPRKECAPLWHDRILEHLPSDRLSVLIGAFAISRYAANRAETMTETIASWEAYLPDWALLPHSSPRNRYWLAKNPWFEIETLPAVRSRISAFL